jgi:hypothetical protein
MNFGTATPALVPLCWPTLDGNCGCGRRDADTGKPRPHTDHDIGKAPLVRWKNYVNAPPSRPLVAAWRKRWPEANTGLLLEPHGLIVVDPDSEEALAEAREFGLPPTLTVKSAKGFHFYYRRPADAPCRRALNRGSSRKLDILSAGYITVPPSRHRLQVTYTVVECTLVGPAPAWAVEFLREAPPPPIDDVASVELPAAVGQVDLDALPVSTRIKRLILEGDDPVRYPSPSEARWAALQALIEAGVDDWTIAGVLLDARFGIAAKPRAEGMRWLAREIGRARAKSDVLILP